MGNSGGNLEAGVKKKEKIFYNEEKRTSVTVSTISLVAPGASLTSLSDLSRRRFRPHVTPKATIARKRPQNHPRRKQNRKDQPSAKYPSRGLDCRENPRPPASTFLHGWRRRDEVRHRCAGEHGREHQREIALISLEFTQREEFQQERADDDRNAHGAGGRFFCLVSRPQSVREIRQPAQVKTPGQHNERDDEQGAAHRNGKGACKRPVQKDEDAPDEEADEGKTRENARHIFRFGFPMRSGPGQNRQKSYGLRQCFQRHPSPPCVS